MKTGIGDKVKPKDSRLSANAIFVENVNEYESIDIHWYYSLNLRHFLYVDI